jgi:hypothetical protein
MDETIRERLKTFMQDYAAFDALRPLLFGSDQSTQGVVMPLASMTVEIRAADRVTPIMAENQTRWTAFYRWWLINGIVTKLAR